MKLDPQLVDLMSKLAIGQAVSIEAERATELARHRALVGKWITPRPSTLHVRDQRIGGPDVQHPVIVRTYTPSNVEKVRPALVFAHGGGWATGSIDTADEVCANLAADADIVVASVEYRLAPEHPYPAGIDDFYHAVLWVSGNASQLGIDPARIAVGGESAGGNLAAIACLKSRDLNGPSIAMQILWAPALDLTFSGPSRHEFQKLFPEIAKFGSRLTSRYLGNGADLKDPYVSPLFCPDLSGLPPAILFACEVDSFRDDCERYGERLIAAGGEARWKTFPGLLHGTQSLTGLLSSAREWHKQSVEALSTLSSA